MGIEVRPAVAADVPLILTLIRELAEYERLAHTVDATEEALAQTLFGERPEAEALIAEIDGDAVGLALFFTNYSTFRARSGIYLEDLFVREHARGLGAGRALLAAVARVALERGCVRLEWAVLNWNTPSIEFYQRLGAEPLDEWTTYRLPHAGIAKLAVATCDNRR